VRSRLAVGRVVAYKSKRVEKTSLSTFLEPRLRNTPARFQFRSFTYMNRPRHECETVRVLTFFLRPRG
jgi:hypothetical protein